MSTVFLLHQISEKFSGWNRSGDNFATISLLCLASFKNSRSCLNPLFGPKKPTKMLSYLPHVYVLGLNEQLLLVEDCKRKRILTHFTFEVVKSHRNKVTFLYLLYFLQNRINKQKPSILSKYQAFTSP